jgi:hypothetical protein
MTISTYDPKLIHPLFPRFCPCQDCPCYLNNYLYLEIIIFNSTLVRCDRLNQKGRNAQPLESLLSLT